MSPMPINAMGQQYMIILTRNFVSVANDMCQQNIDFSTVSNFIDYIGKYEGTHINQTFPNLSYFGNNWIWENLVYKLWVEGCGKQKLTLKRNLKSLYTTNSGLAVFLSFIHASSQSFVDQKKPDCDHVNQRLSHGDLMRGDIPSKDDRCGRLCPKKWNI